MGNKFIDQYTYLHFATGIIAYFWNISLIWWLIIHGIFEFIENIEYVQKNINKIPLWPGGKPKPDKLINIIGDNVGALLGWMSAKKLDELGALYSWYPKHIT